MTTYIIENSQRPMSNTSYHNRCTKGQKNWWLRNKKMGEFVDIGEHRGDKNISIEVDLEPGVYILGCGPQDHGCRETITVE